MDLKELTQEEYKLIDGGSEASEGFVQTVGILLHHWYDYCVATFVDGCRS